MKLDEFGNKYGDAIAKFGEGYFRGSRMAEDKADRAERREDRETMRGRQEEAYQHGLTRRPITDEIQDNQLARDRIGLTQVQDANDFKTTVRKAAVQALKGFQVGNTDLVGNFYNQYVEDGKTGSFVQDKDGSYRHEYVDDITGEAGTEVFSQDQMQAVLQRASQADDEFLSMLQKMSAATAAQKAKFAEEDYKQKGRMELEGVKNKGKAATNAGKVTLKNGQTVDESDLRSEYNTRFGKYDPMGNLLGMEQNAPTFEEYRNDLVAPQFARQFSGGQGLTQQDQALTPEELDRARVGLNTADGGDRANDWIPFNEPSDDQVRARAYEGRGQSLTGGLPPNPGGGQTARGQVIRDQNLSRALEAISAGKDPAAVRQRLLEAGYREDQLQAAGIR